MGNIIQLSVVIITFNEEKNIKRCLDSVLKVADEILVIDSLSTDATKIICLDKGIRFIENQFEDYTHQKNFGISQATYHYILSVDADEYLSERLCTSILKIKSNWVSGAYSMNRLSSYGGKWIKNGNWYPDKKIRLWDRRLGMWGGGTPHEKVILNNGVRTIHVEGDLMHTAYKDSEQTISKIQQYSTIFARENRRKKKTSIAKIIGHTFFSFSKSYFIKLGLLDGFEGLMVAAAEANHVFYKYSKLFETNKRLQISLVITTYNRKDALELVLLSVVRQQILPFEVIIADDGSGVDTKLLIDRFQKGFPIPLHHCWHEDQGFRLSAIRNKAVCMASGEYIIMIDGDMVLPRSFIKAHKQNAWHGHFIQGSRVLMMKDKTNKILKRKETRINFFASGIDNRMNAIESSLLSKLFSYYRTGLNNVRGANLSFWKDDLIKVNGFNEDFEGWGREDSEFAVRMENQGIKRKHLKFAGFGYHLYHPENSRKQLPQNDAILQETIDKKLKRCNNGISKKSVSKAA